RNGYNTSKPKTPSYVPYKLKTSGRLQQKTLESENIEKITPLQPLLPEEWTQLARDAKLIEEHQAIRDYQVEAANLVLERRRDLCVIAQTGAGKTLVWMLPLYAQKAGISLVIIPYTSLGHQGEQRYQTSGVRSIFLHSGAKDRALLEEVVCGGGRRVIYVCPEMLETPTIACLLHSESFQAQLSGIYIDEAHCVQESHTWRPSYTNIHQLRRVVGTDVPLIALSATLPTAYRTSLETYTGLKPDYHLINLGNFRPELSTIIRKMQHPTASFLDLKFVIPWSATAETVPSTIIYCDDIESLTEMFWWFRARPSMQKLPPHFVEIMHAGLSERHQQLATKNFEAGRARVLLATDKIGAGMDFPHVTLVVQYGCRDLTLVKWEQRRGRGARRRGMTAVG
ncbi:P-loop containing nucleoside triphosphate hydrolase protein, partial [Crepidotus variabilis]